MAAPLENAVTEAEFARIQGLKPKYVRELRLTGRLVMNDAGLILGRESAQRIRETADRSKPGTYPPPVTVDRANAADFALIAGVKPSYVTQLKREDRLVMAADGLIDVAASLARIRETADPSKAGVAARHEAERAANAAQRAPEADDDDEGPAAPAERTSSSYQDSRARREHYLALAVQRDYEMSIGELLNAGDVASTLADAATALRVRLESLADTLAPQLAAEPDEARCRALIADAHEHALGELARAFGAAQRPAKP